MPGDAAGSPGRVLVSMSCLLVQGARVHLLGEQRAVRGLARRRSREQLAHRDGRRGPCSFPSGGPPQVRPDLVGGGGLWFMTLAAGRSSRGVRGADRHRSWYWLDQDDAGRNGGKPLAGPALERFLPWTTSPEDLRTWARCRQPDKTGTHNARTDTATTPTLGMLFHRTSEYLPFKKHPHRTG